MANDETLDSTNPPQREQNVTTEQVRLEQWLAVRKEAGHHIDAETAEVDWGYAEVLDPYGVDPPDQEYRCVGREYFARSPGSDIWVWFGDLPAETQDALWRKDESQSGFPIDIDSGWRSP